MPQDDLWVFAYGSLLWRPGFPFAERRRATLEGYARRFCMASVHYRGTPAVPGLVLALDRAEGQTCQGLAYRVGPEAAEAVLAYLRERELVSYAYDEARLPVALEDGARPEAVTFVSNRGHPQYRGGLGFDEQAAIIARAVGPMGPNAEYLFQTVASLASHGIEDPELSALARLVETRTVAGPPRRPGMRPGSVSGSVPGPRPAGPES